MRKIIALFLLLSTAAYAADNSVILDPGSTITMRTKDVGSGVQSPYNILGDVTGTAIYGTAGTANTNVLTVQGIASGTAIPVSLTSTTITGTVAATQSGAWTNTVTQATAASLNATVVGTGTFAVQATLAAETTKVIGTVNQGTSPWVVSLTSTTITGTVAATQSGTWNITNVSGTISLPTGAATSAKQPALGTAGTASSDVLTVQGIASMTPLLVTLSGTNNINNISGTITLPTLASTSTKQSDGTQKTQIVDGSGNVIASTSNNLNVQCANCSGSGVSTVDEATFTAGTSLFAGTGGFFQTTSTNNALTNGQQGMLQMTANRAAFTNCRTAAGAECGIASLPFQVSLANTGANTNKLLVTPDSVALPANQSVNVAQMNGVTTSMNVGSADTGTQRVSQADALSLTPASVTSATTIFTQDMQGYGSISVQVTSAGSATITYETSDDNSTWVSTSGSISTAIGQSSNDIITTSTTVGLRVFPKRGRYFRARVSTYTSGTVTVFATVHKDPFNVFSVVDIGGVAVTITTTTASSTLPVVTMNSANANSGINSAIAAVLDDNSPTVPTENNFSFLRMTPNRALVMKPYSTTAGGDWTYAAATGGISNTTTAVTVKTADAANKNCVTSIDLSAGTLGAGTEFAIRDGAGGTVLWRFLIGTAGLVNGFVKTFPTPICGAAVNTLLEVVTLTASISGALYVNVQGYAAP